MKTLSLISIILLSLFDKERLEMQVVTSLEKDPRKENYFVKSEIILGENYLNKVKLVNIRGNDIEYNISLFYDDDKNYYLYDSIKKHYPTVKIYELNRVSEKKYVITDTLLIASLNDTLNFNFSQKRKNSFLIYNDGFMPKNYRIEKKR